MAQKYLYKPPFLVKKSYTEQAIEITRAYRKYAELLHLQLIRKGRIANPLTDEKVMGYHFSTGLSSKQWSGANTRIREVLAHYTPEDHSNGVDTPASLSEIRTLWVRYENREFVALDQQINQGDNKKAKNADYSYEGYKFYLLGTPYSRGILSSKTSYTGRYNIKSSSREPYSYDGALGLNQFFVGQDPYKPYQGDPSDGIYHDECAIKTLPNTKLSISADAWEKLSDPEYELKLPMDIGGGKELIKICETRYITTKEIEIGRKAENIMAFLFGGEVIVTYASTQYRCLSGFTNYGEYFEFVPVRTDNITHEETDVGEHHTNTRVVIDQYRIAKNYTLTRYCAFYAESELVNHPLNVRRFIDEWSDYHELYVYEDTEWWEDFLAPVIIIIAIVITVYSAGAASAAWGALGAAGAGSAAATTATISLVGAVGGVISGVGLLVTGFGMASGSSSLMKIGKIMGLVGAVATLGASIANLARTAVSSVANSAKSVISSAGNATQNGLNQTSSLYLNTGAMNASGNGSSTMTFGELLKNGNNMSFGEALNTNVALSAGASDSLASASLGVIKSTIKAYSSTKDAFKNPNDFDDDEMPVDSDTSEEREVFYHYDNRLRINTKYAAEDNTDLGLMEGSLGYVKTQLESVKTTFEYPWEQESLKTRVLPIKKWIDYFKKPYKKTKK